MPPRKSTRKSKTQKGKGISDVLKFIKDNKLVSKGLGMIPHPGAQAAASLAAMAGLGRKRRSKTAKKGSLKTPRAKTTRRSRSAVVPASMQGRGIFGDLGGGIGSIFGGLGSGVGSIAHGLFGGSARGRKRGTTRLGIRI